MAYDPIIDFYDEPGGPNGGYKGGGSGGGGGGDVALGGKQHTPTYTLQPPTVGDTLDNISELYVKSLYVGNQQVLFPDENDQYQIYNYNTVIALAAGSKATLVTHADESPETTAYVVKIGSRPTDLGSEGFLESVEPWDGEYTESYDDQQLFLSLTVTIPELDYAGGEMLLFYIAEG